MDVKNLTSNFEKCQGCNVESDPINWNHSPWFCDNCYIKRVYETEKLREAGVFCCGILNPGPRGPEGLPGDIDLQQPGSVAGVKSGARDRKRSKTRS